MGNLTVDGVKPSLKEIVYNNGQPATNVVSGEAKFFQTSTGEHTDVFVSQAKRRESGINVSKQIVSKTLKLIVDMEEKAENSKSFVDKTVDFFKGLFAAKSDNKKIFNTASFMTNPVKAMILSVRNKAVADLEKHGIDFKELTPTEKIKYLGILTNYRLGNIDNEEFLKAMTDLHKERAKEAVKNNWPPMIQKFNAFLKDKFSVFFKKTGQIDNAALETALTAAPREIAHELLRMYSTTIEARRKEILAEAFKALPEGLDKESIVQFATTSENMSEEQFNFAKTLIESSDLPDDVKAEYLKKIEEDRKNQRYNSVQHALTFYQSRVDGGYEYHKAKLLQSDAAYERLCAEQQVINKKLSLAKEKREQLEEQKFYTERHMQKLERDMKQQFEKGEKISISTKIAYATLENKAENLEKNLYDIRKDITSKETDWGVTQFLRREAVDSSSAHVRAMQVYNTSACADYSFFRGITEKIGAIFS